MKKSTTENFQPEQKPNSEPQPIDSTSSLAIGNTNVVRRLSEVLVKISNVHLELSEFCSELKNEPIIFEQLIQTIERNASNNEATIRNVALWAKNWREEIKINSHKSTYLDKYERRLIISLLKDRIAENDVIPNSDSLLTAEDYKRCRGWLKALIKKIRKI